MSGAMGDQGRRVVLSLDQHIAMSYNLLWVLNFHSLPYIASPTRGWWALFLTIIYCNIVIYLPDINHSFPMDGRHLCSFRRPSYESDFLFCLFISILFTPHPQMFCVCLFICFIVVSHIYFNLIFLQSNNACAFSVLCLLSLLH